MGRTRPAYPPEFREQMVALVRAGRRPEELAREFEPSAQSIRNWVVQADLDEGRRTDGLTTQEREELRRRISVRVRESQSGELPGAADVPSAGRLPQAGTVRGAVEGLRRESGHQRATA